jgi:hypothetical protein
MSQHRLPDRIWFATAFALALGATYAPAQPRPGPPPSTPGGPGGPPSHGGLPLVAPPKPYKPVAVTLPQPFNEWAGKPSPQPPPRRHSRRSQTRKA